MKKVFTLALLLTAFAHATTMKAQPLSGTYTLPVIGMTNLAQAIQRLNTFGVTGNVTINLTADETAPSGGFVLGSPTLNLGTNASSATQRITINGNGFILTAPTGVGGTDAIFKIQGPDFVTLNKIVFSESSANTTNAQMMEWGVAIVKSGNGDGDGTQNCAIKNCKITLNKNNTTAPSGVSPKGATGIFIGNCMGSSTSPLALTAFGTTANSDIFINQDTITNVTNGIHMAGYPFPNPIAVNDQSMTITENLITNFTRMGVYLIYSNNDQVSKNRINNMADGGTAPADSIRGIFNDGPVLTATNNSWTCDDNVIDLTIAGNVTSSRAIGIWSQLNGTGFTYIRKDTVKLTASATSALLIGIYSQNTLGTQEISNNLVRDFTTSSTNTHHTVGIWNGQTTYSPYGYPASSQISNNVITGFNVNTTGLVAGCIDQNSTVATSNFTNNIVSNFTINGNATEFRGYSNGAAVAATNIANITGNKFTDITASGTTPCVVINPKASTLVTFNITGNVIRNLSFNTGQIRGIDVDWGVKATVNNDTFQNIVGNADVYGIKAGYTGSGVTTHQFNDNVFSTMSSGGSASVVAAIAFTPGTTYVTSSTNMYNNRISSILASGAGSTVYGIHIAGGSTAHTIFNNVISDVIAASNTAAYSSSFGMNILGGGNNTVLHNTINLKSGVGASGFGATGILYNNGGTNTFKNNLVNVNITAGSTNNVVAMRAMSGSPSAAPSATSFAAENNIYYTPTGSANFLYGEGTTSIVNGFNVAGLTANTTSNIANDTFFNSTCGTSKYKKFMGTAAPKREEKTFTEFNLAAVSGGFAPSGMSFAESGGTLTSVPSDIKGTARSSTPDIGAFEFTGTVVPKLGVSITSSTTIDTACKDNLPTLTATFDPYFERLSYQWYKDTSKIVGATDSFFKIDVAGGNYYVQAYDSATGCKVLSELRNIYMMPPPPAIVTYYDSLVFCETSSIVLTANKGRDYTYQWYKNGIMLPGETNIGLVVSTSGSYSVEVNTPLGCPTHSKTIGVSVYPIPNPVITITGPKILGTGKYYTYQWYYYNMPIAGAVGRYYYATVDGPYAVEVTDSNGCTNKSSVYLYSLGVNDPSVAEAIKTYPNPTNGVMKIDAPVNVNISLKDMTGRVVLEKTNAKEIDLTGYAEGMYIMSISDKDGNLIKMVKVSKTE